MINLDGALSFFESLGQKDMRERTVQYEIDGIVYTSSKLPARQGLELWARLGSLLGPGLLRAIATAESEGIDPRALITVAERAMRDGVGSLCLSLLDRTQANKRHGRGEPGPIVEVFDEHFAGEYGHLLKVLAFVISHNLRGPTLGGR